MITVKVKTAGEQSKKEWCLLELQGELKGDLIGEVGKIEIRKNGKAEMDIGQYFLEGSVCSLAKPYLILEQHNNSSSDSSDSNDSNGSSTNPLEMVGYVRKKIIFKDRPKSLALKKLRVK